MGDDRTNKTLPVISPRPEGYSDSRSSLRQRKRGKCQSSTLPPEVEMAGIEPASDDERPGLLRAQSACGVSRPSPHPQTGR